MSFIANESVLVTSPKRSKSTRDKKRILTVFPLKREILMSGGFFLGGLLLSTALDTIVAIQVHPPRLRRFLLKKKVVVEMLDILLF